MGYMKQHKLKHSVPTQAIPPKPTDVGRFMTARINAQYEELCDYVTSHTHYIGMAEFSDNSEQCIEIKFASNEKGKLFGKRISICNGYEIDGHGKIYRDVEWDDERREYVGCLKFEWMDVDKKKNGLKMQLFLNTQRDYLDLDHLYFEGQCASGDKHGCFNLVCVSMRKRHCDKRNGLLQYHEVDLWAMDESELQSSSSRDNSIIIIRVLIRIIVYDLDVELNIFICVAAYIFSMFDY